MVGATGKRIARARFEAGYKTPEALAKRLGITAESVRAWERGDSMPSYRNLDNLVNLTGRSRAWLLGEEEADVADEIRRLRERLEQMEEPQTYAVGMEPVDGFVLVPFIGAASAGDGTFAEDDPEYLQRIDTISLPSGHEESCFLTEARGDSMADAGIAHGDHLLICKSMPVNDGDIAVLNVDGEVVVKRVYNRKRYLVLVSENPDYPPREVDEAQLIGVVMWSRRMHKKM